MPQSNACGDSLQKFRVGTCISVPHLKSKLNSAPLYSPMRRQLLQLLRPISQPQIRSASWRTQTAIKAETPALPPAARIDRAEIIRRTEAQVRNLVAGGAGAEEMDEEEIQLIVEARRRIWGALNGGKMHYSLPPCLQTACAKDEDMTD